MSQNADPVFQQHDHAHCAEAALAHAEQKARERGLRLTPLRRRVLEILLEDHRALGAYDVLERLAGDGQARQPPAAYRALEFLTEQGFAHRIQRLNAYTACMQPGEAHEPAFLICEGCRMVAEAPVDNLRAGVGRAAQGLGFSVSRVSVEVVGLCPACRG